MEGLHFRNNSGITSNSKNIYENSDQRLGDTIQPQHPDRGPSVIVGGRVLRQIKTETLGIQQNKKKLFVSFVLEIILFCFFIGLIAHISNKKTPNEIDILREKYESLKEKAGSDIFQKLENIQNDLNSLKEVKHKYTKLQQDIRSTKGENEKIQKKIASVNKKFTEYENIKKCGKTTKIVRSNARVIVSHDNTEEYLPCTNEKPCYCYGRLCLIGGTCSSGHVYLDGRPIAGVSLNKCNKERICKDLGFQNIAAKDFPNRSVCRALNGCATNGCIYLTSTPLCKHLVAGLEPEKTFAESAVFDPHDFDYCKDEPIHELTCTP